MPDWHGCALDGQRKSNDDNVTCVHDCDGTKTMRAIEQMRIWQLCAFEEPVSDLRLSWQCEQYACAV